MQEWEYMTFDLAKPQKDSAATPPTLWAARSALWTGPVVKLGSSRLADHDDGATFPGAPPGARSRAADRVGGPAPRRDPNAEPRGATVR